MRLRQLGWSGVAVSEIGFGGWGIGNSSWIGAEDRESLAALTAARNAGITLYDTALVYGQGHSEQLIGQAFGKSDEVVIASKAPPKNRMWPAPQGTRLEDAYPREHIRKCLDQTLRNLRRETIDLYQFHVWSDEWASHTEWQEAVQSIRREGKVRHIGISINDHQPFNVIRALATGLIDVVQVIYNIFDQSPEDGLLTYCADHGIGVIARVPFDEGGLTGKIRPDSVFPEGDFRNRYFAGARKREVWERAQRIATDGGVSIDDLPELALRFCLTHPAVSAVIPGMRTTDHVLKNAKAAERGPLCEELAAKMRPHRWIRNFYEPGPTVRSRARDLVAGVQGRLQSFIAKP